MSDYNDGFWHGWNGGECPVHPETLVTCMWQCKDGFFDGDTDKAKMFAWHDLDAFRVVKEYREPVITNYNGECHAYHYIGLEPTTAPFNVGDNSIHGRWTATHVDGKLQSFTWKAT